MLNTKWQRISAAKADLRLPDHATLKEIKAAYRKLCKEHHPDLASDADQSDIMQEVNAAFAALLDYCTGLPIPPRPSTGGQRRDGPRGLVARSFW